MKKLSLFLLIVVAAQPVVQAHTIYSSPRYSLESDRILENGWQALAISPTEIESNYSPTGKPAQPPRRWTLETNLSALPQVKSDYVLLDALYNLSLEEMHKDIRPDGTFMAGAKWDGVWTRDISFSILLALAAIEPGVSKASLLEKVKRGRIVQDTGTGGSWPVSTDRMVWALAAWEIYQVTGDRPWLEQAFEIIRASAADDEQVAFSKSTGLALGESSFLDWREQTYPRWMDPVDIYSAQALGTNAVHYRTYRILADMARLLGHPSEPYEETANRLREGINKLLWLEQKGYYGQYLYGRNYLSVSPRPEALGESLAILFDIASEDRQDSILRSFPLVDYGIPCIYPEIPGIPPYHNNAIWPFVQAFWNLAAAKRHNESALLQGLAALYRPAALFLTNQENMVAGTGSNVGTEINSERQLWSVAGNLAMTYRVLFGMEFTSDGLKLHPVIPAVLDGTRTLENFRYRQALLSIEVRGFGGKVHSVTLDGKPLPSDLVPSTIEGQHKIEIVMAHDPLTRPGINVVEDNFAPDTPVIHRDGDLLSWDGIKGASQYTVYRNGKPVAQNASTSFALTDPSVYAEYQVVARDAAGWESFRSEPFPAYPRKMELIVEAESVATPATEPLTGFTGTGFIELSRTTNRQVVFPVALAAAGDYVVNFRYSNGSGPINTENKCALRTLSVDGKPFGAIVLPQRGTNQWSNWGYSSRQLLTLGSGKHTIGLSFEPSDENMNPEINRAMLDHLRLVKVK